MEWQIKSTPSSFQCSKHLLKQRAPPSTPESAQDQSLYLNGLPHALVKCAGPHNAAYPISISTKPTSLWDMLSANSSRDSSEPCLGITRNQDNIFRASSTDRACTGVGHYFELTGIDSDDEVEDFAAKANSLSSKKSRNCATQHTLPGACKRIVELAKIYLHAIIST